MKNCIIFGGNGFIGSHLAQGLKNKFNIYSFSNSDFTPKKKIKKFSYTLKNFKTKIMKVNPTVIFFLSGNSYPNNSLDKHLYDLHRSNIIIQNFLTALKELNFKGKVIYTSSIAVYGKDKNFKKNYVTEKSTLNPKNYYGLSKVIAENQFIYFHKNFSLKIYILRLSSIFGMSLNRQIIYEIIKVVNNKNVKKITLNGKMNDSRQFIFIDDLISILCKLINNKKSFLLLNISNGKKYQIKDILSYVQKKMKVKKLIKYKNQTSPEFPILRNAQLLKELKHFKFESFYKSLDKTINYWIS
jgi:nucleoside-diphosphate-sugar epimerase